jgi:hypothetical protein
MGKPLETLLHHAATEHPTVLLSVIQRTGGEVEVEFFVLLEWRHAFLLGHDSHE